MAVEDIWARKLWVCVSNLHGLHTIPENFLGTMQTGRDLGKATKLGRIRQNLDGGQLCKKDAGQEFPFSTRPRGQAGRVSYYPPFTLKTTCKLTENKQEMQANTELPASLSHTPLTPTMNLRAD